MTPTASEKEEMNNIVKKAFEDLTDDEANNLKRLITILFPRQQNTIYGPEWEKTWTEEKRIASQKYFDRYFTYSIPIGDVSDILIEDFIASLDRIDSEQLIKVIDRELNEQNEESFIAKLTQKIERISPEGKIKLAVCLSLFGQRFPNPKGLFSGFTTPFSRAAILIARLIETLPENIDKVDLATKIINVAEPISFAFTIVRWFKTKKVENEKDVISSDELQKINSTLAARIESLATKNYHFFETYPDHAPVMIWFWGKYGSKENADKFMTEFLNEDIKNVHTLLNSVVPIAYPMDGSPPGKSEFERDQYNYLQSFVDLNLVYELLKKEYGGELESEEYPDDFGKPLDLRIARQFAWIHKKVLEENQTLDAKNDTENSA